jgi:hypothetical protein
MEILPCQNEGISIEINGLGGTPTVIWRSHLTMVQ